MSCLLLKRAATSRPSGKWNDDDYDVLADGDVVGRIYKANATPAGTPWMWTLAFWHHEDRTPTHGYAATREAAMTAFEAGGGNDEKAPRLPASHSPQSGDETNRLGSNLRTADGRVLRAMPESGA
jgi:hypothetical protein